VELHIGRSERGQGLLAQEAADGARFVIVAVVHVHVRTCIARPCFNNVVAVAVRVPKVRRSACETVNGQEHDRDSADQRQRHGYGAAGELKIIDGYCTLGRAFVNASCSHRALLRFKNVGGPIHISAETISGQRTDLDRRRVPVIVLHRVFRISDIHIFSVTG
jgi:hypothetical protein